MVAASHSQAIRQSLHLYIDSSPYNAQPHISPGSNSPSSSSAHPSIGTAGTTPTSGFDSIICSVLCMYDFRSDDPDHLPFYKNEILDIMKQEDTGWWAAMRRGGDEIGWIPQAFVKPLSYEMTEKLRSTREELRGYEYDAEQLYISAPIQRNQQLYESAESSPSIPSIQKRPDPRDKNSSKKPSPQEPLQSDPDFDPSYHFRCVYLQRAQAPPSPTTPMPQPPTQLASLDSESTLNSTGQGVPPHLRTRAGTVPPRGFKRQPVLVDDRPTLNRLSTFLESNNTTELYRLASPRATGSFDVVVKRPQLKPSLGVEESRVSQNMPWYLKPSHSDQLEVDADGHVRSGTLIALVEKLTSSTPARDAIRIAEDTTFRNIFLMTFRTFTTADEFFDMLVDRFRMNHPENMAGTEFENWKKHHITIQRHVLTIFTMWLEGHRLLEEEPHVAQRLTDFLNLIITPPLAVTARLVIQTIERLTFANPTASSPAVSPRKARKSRPHKNDLLKLNPIDVAEQLSLLEFKRYARITPQECIPHASTQAAQCDGNLSAFCSTHDKLASWVKISVLNSDALGRRADSIDFWIKVAEKCRNLNNFASMSAVINALSSTVITRLHLTWAHVGRKSNLEGLLRYNEPTGGFSGYRGLLCNVDGPCVPFVGMYMTDIAHINDQFDDEGGRISFLKRQRWYEAVSTMLRHQSKPYDIAESESTMNFIWRHLLEDNIRDQSWFWSRSQDVQQLEKNNADIRRGLEAAGF